MSKIIDIEISDRDFDLLVVFQEYKHGTVRQVAGQFLSMALKDFCKGIKEAEELNPEPPEVMKEEC